MKPGSLVLILKGVFYRYTGVYLAQKEELEYLTSREFWDEFMRIASHPENDLYPRDIQGILIGTWQIRSGYGFARPMSMLEYRSPRLVFGPIAWFHVLFLQAQSDFRSLVAKIRK